MIEICDENFLLRFKNIHAITWFFMVSSYGNRNVWREQKNYNRAHLEIKQLSHGSINIIISMINVWHISQTGR